LVNNRVAAPAKVRTKILGPDKIWLEAGVAAREKRGRTNFCAGAVWIKSHGPIGDVRVTIGRNRSKAQSYEGTKS
jgi:hypothetical protein